MKLVLIGLLVFMVFNTAANAAPDTTDAYYYEPYPMKQGQTVLQFGMTFTLLPLPLAENEYPTPAVDAQIKYGISESWSAVGIFSTNIFSSILHGGIQWNAAIDRTSIGIGLNTGIFYGFISTEGQFDNNTAYAFVGIPMIRIGHRRDEFSTSATFGASYVFSSATSVSGLEAPGPTGTINDLFCTLAIEQPFLTSSHISIGVSISYARTPYQTWLLFNTIDQYLFVPEFFFAVQL